MSKIGIIIDEMKEQAHPMRVEDVIEIALKEFAKNHAGEFSGAIAYSIVSRLEEEEEEEEAPSEFCPLCDSTNVDLYDGTFLGDCCKWQCHDCGEFFAEPEIK